ncbi:hypothetical protein M0G43_07955 [Subsaxibacter sp. CAU 1640]|uniref:hypothetical protein n=1 Tax=Subsaxibacter sp. CAU 1640 TaxID=2933271 RepID=UPI002003F994|nr:hypothetical protein [Subsaxibacter sp. CAU 1640]MCK7590501.1 hypothetical protein [Subsaxibacter sp. CAU 1640]
MNKIILKMHKKMIARMTIIAMIMILSCKAQNISYQQDETLLIYFEKDGINQIRLPIKDTLNYSIAIYQYLLHDSNKYPQLNESISFSYRNYRDFDDMNSDNPIPSFRVNEKFLKNNAGIIIDLNDMQDLGFEKTMSIFKKAKHIFMIDKDDSKDGLIIIKEVFLSYAGKE